jgi:hypothetical protein
VTWGQFTWVQLTEVHFSAYRGHFVPDAFCPGGILREAFDWGLFVRGLLTHYRLG